MRDEAVSALDRLSLYHVPAPAAQLAARLQSFLANWWRDVIPTAGTPAAATEAVVQAGRARDWMLILAEFPLAIVDEACREYLKTTDKKPMPASVYAICKRLDKQGQMISRLKILLTVPVEKEPERHQKEESKNPAIWAWMEIYKARGSLTGAELAMMTQGVMPPSTGAAS